MDCPPTSLTSDDLDLIEAAMAGQARRSFWAFRQYMHPKLIKGWWLKDSAAHLQQFYADMAAGLRPSLLIQAPPQHGKSMMVVDFIAWVIGHNPDLATIYASFSGRLGTRANLSLQRIMASYQFRRVFPGVSLPDRTSNRQVNTEVIEFIGGDGVFRNTTVKGSITGEGLDLGVLDDPIKGSEEARSANARDKAWEWLTDDFMTRFSDHAGLLGIMTRWHLDDPFGRLIDAKPKIKVLRYPAIAEQDEAHRKEGDALFPEHKPLDFLMARKALMIDANWAALYQQSPTITGGGLFRDEWWRVVPAIPPLEYRAIYADTASKTKTMNDWTVFQCWGKTRDGQAILIDLVRGKWEAPELLVQARAFWAKHIAVLPHVPLRAFKVEDASSGTGLIQTLRRRGSDGQPPLPMIGIGRDRDKVSRAMDVAPLVQSGQALLLDQAWLSEFIAECSVFPNGAHDDQVDPMMDALTDMIGPTVSEPRIRML